MAYWHISPWIKWLYPAAIWYRRGKGKSLYLTFDDGPTPFITEKILDILDQYNAKATFFCLGRNVERHREIYHTILKKGHSVGNHTYSHLKGWKSDNIVYFEDIELARQHIESLLFRPPYGQIRPSQIRYLKKKYKIIMWEIMSHDYNKRISKEKSLQKVLKYTKEGSIIVFHDSLKAWETLQFVLPKLLKYFNEKGFGFERIV
jgi:peptidoglycan/xylan/chitin deacetylase (PgdA/CDA1 family)